MFSLFALSLLVPSAIAASPSLEPYTTAVRLVDRLFLQPETVSATGLLLAASRRLESDVHWLRVTPGPTGLVLRHGDGTVLGSVQVADMDDLPRALEALERQVAEAGHDLEGVSVSLSVLTGLADGLDRYSRVLANERLDRFNVRLSGTLVGIGTTFRIDPNERMVVSWLTADGPAAQADVRVGDVVVRIDGRSTVNMPISEASRRIQGIEGTQLTLTLLRDDAEHVQALTRAKVVVPNVTHRVLEGSVGYVHIDHVSQRTVENLRKSLEALRQQGALEHGLVVDLRGNTGGSMKEAARAADQFLDSGLLLRTVGKDGGRVQNLQAEMSAAHDGDEPEVPIVLLADERTASGAEIMAGALLELDRAAIVGTRSYGKGTVQKIYNLDDNVRLKLTVARYILANDRRISDGGLMPDVLVGQIRLDGYGVRFRGWDEGRLEVPWDHIIPEVDETPGWRGREVDTDLALELARRSVASSTGTDRAVVLAELQRHAKEARVEQEVLLADALSARGVDWSPAAQAGSTLHANVSVTAVEAGGDTYKVEVSVTNTGTEVLHRGLVEVRCDSASHWNGLVVPVGRVEPGATGSGEVRVALPTGILARADTIDVRLRADQRPTLQLPSQVLLSVSTPDPALRLQASLGPQTGAVGPNGHPVKAVRVVVENLSRNALPGVEVHFAYPDDEHIELVDRGARTGMVPAKGSAELFLDVEVAPTAPLVLPLRVVVEADRHRSLADWPLSLSTLGDPVTLQAPTITVKRDALSTDVGPWTVPIEVIDDQGIDHVVVWANGEKVAWQQGAGTRVQLGPLVDIQPGENRIVVITRDDQGVEARLSVSVRGVSHPASVDAHDPE